MAEAAQFEAGPSPQGNAREPSRDECGGWHLPPAPSDVFWRPCSAWFRAELGDIRDHFKVHPWPCDCFGFICSVCVLAFLILHVSYEPLWGSDKNLENPDKCRIRRQTRACREVARLVREFGKGPWCSPHTPLNGSQCVWWIHLAFFFIILSDCLHFIQIMFLKESQRLKKNPQEWDSSKWSR